MPSLSDLMPQIHRVPHVTDGMPRRMKLLYSHLDRNPFCTSDELSAETGVRLSTTRKYMSDLKALGYVRKHSTGLYKPCRWEVIGGCDVAERNE